MDEIKLEVIKKVFYTEVEELYKIEDMFINKYDTINNGYNSRRNFKNEEN